MWWGKKKDRAPVFVVNRRAAVLAFVILALAAWMAGGGAAMLSDDPYVQAVLVALSVAAVLYESVSLVLAQHAKARNDWASVVWSRGLLVVAIFYTAGMQCTFLGPKLMKPRFDDQASAGAIAVLDQRIAALEERRKALPAVPGTPESFSWLIEQLEPDKSKAGQTKLRQAKSDMAVAKGVVALDKQIKDLNDERVKLLGRPPSDAKALLVSLVSNWDPQVVNLLWMILGVVFLQLTNVFMSRIRGLDYLQLAAAVPKPAKNDDPVPDKSGSTGNTGGSETRTPATGDNVTPFPERKVSVASATKRNGLDHEASPPAPPVSHAGPSEPAGTALVPVSHVSLPSARDLMIGPARPSKAQEPHVSVFPKITARDKGKERWETFEERYRDLDDLIAETDRMPPIRELAKRWECRPETVIKIRNRWSDLNEGPGGKRAAGKLPVRRERGNGKRPKLGNGLGELSGQYGPQHAALQ